MRRSLVPIAAAVIVLAGSSVAVAVPRGAAARSARSVQPITATTVESSNWAGYAASGSAGAFSSVVASWTQPEVSCADGEYSYSSFWVGLDGYESKTVEQIGTDSDCRDGKPAYFAWYEAYPKLSARCSLTVASGDVITASVRYRSGRLKLSLTDGSETCGASVKANSSIDRSSAEVIVEAPSSNHGPSGTLGLADFGSVSFTRVSVNGDTIAKASPDKIVMKDGKAVKASPRKLHGDRFSLTWEHH
jgi:hypothetical protein